MKFRVHDLLLFHSLVLCSSKIVAEKVNESWTISMFNLQTLYPDRNEDKFDSFGRFLLNFTFWIKLKSVELMVELNMQFFVVIYAVITDNKPFSELGGMTLKITDNDEKKVSQLSSTGHN